MEFLLLVVAAVFGIVLARQSSRISTVEKQLKAFQAPQTTQNSYASNSSSTTASAIISTGAATTNSSVQNAPLIPPIPAKTGGGYDPLAPLSSVGRGAPASISQQNGTTESRKEESAGVILGRIGIAGVVLGAIFFLKFAFDNNWIDETGRIILGLIGGAGIFALGHYLHTKYQEYGSILMGGGTTILYFSVYSAYAFYDLIPVSVAYAGFIVITLVACVVSIVRTAPSLLIISGLGAFLAPLIFTTPNPSFIALALYLTLIGVGISYAALYRKWNPITYLPAVCTIFVFSVWYGQHYEQKLLPIVALFALIWTTMYVGIGIVLMTRANSKDDKMGVLLTTLSYFVGAFILYVLFQEKYADYLGIGAVIMAMHAGIAAYIAHVVTQGKLDVGIIMAGITATFLTIAVQLQFDGVWVGVAWVVESLVLYYLASRIQDRGFQVMGAIVFALGAMNVLINEWARFDVSKPFVPILNNGFFAMTLVVVVASLIAFMYYRFGSITPAIQKRGITVFFVVANVSLLLTVTSQITKFYSYLASVTYEQARTEVQTTLIYSGKVVDTMQDDVYQKANITAEKLGNTAHTIIYIFYAIYAAFLILVGFVKRIAGPRKLGVALFILTVVLVVFRVWSLGPVYRIVATIGVGVLALVASFVYAKYKDRLIGTATAVVFGIMLAAGNAQAVYEPTQWQFSQDIEYSGVNSSQPFVEVVIPESVTGVDSQGKSIRIIRNDNEEVSYAVVHRSTFASDEVVAKVLNTSSRDGYTYAMLDVGSNSVYSGITLRIRNLNFNRQVKVYAADSQLGIDGSAWRLVSDNGYIYSFAENEYRDSARQSYTTIELPKMSSRYLKIEIVPGTEGALIIDGVRVESSAESVVPRTYSQSVENAVSFDKKTKASTVTADLGRLYNVSEITLGINEGNFVRQATVFTSTNGVDYSIVGNGRLYAIRSQTFTGAISTIIFSPVVARYVKIVIANGDSAPLEFTPTMRVRGPLGSLIFDGSAQGEYKLVYGNPRAEAPYYDTEMLVRFVSASEVNRAFLGEVMINAEYDAPPLPHVPFAEKYPHALTFIVMLFVVLGVGLVVWYILRTHTKDLSTVGMVDGIKEVKEETKEWK